MSVVISPAKTNAIKGDDYDCVLGFDVYSYLCRFEQPRPYWLMLIDLQVSEQELDAVLMHLWQKEMVWCINPKLRLWKTRL